MSEKVVYALSEDKKDDLFLNSAFIRPGYDISRQSYHMMILRMYGWYPS